MKNLSKIMISAFIITLFVLLAACNNSTSEEVAGSQATEAPEATATSEPPTNTPEPPTATPEPPTNTPPPTDTPTPTPTDTPVPPTDTPAPTDTPVPTDTPTPENTPTPSPPTATPTPEVSPVDEHFAQGGQYYEEKAYDKAIIEFEEVIKLAPDLAVAHAFLGYSYALGPKAYDKAIASLETYLRLNPDADDRAQVEQDIEFMRNAQASQQDTDFEIPPGKALFVFKNYSGEDWNVDIGPYHLEVPANPPDREFTYATLAIDPGTYSWQAHSPGGGYYITDGSGNKSFEFTVAAGQMYGTQCCR